MMLMSRACGPLAVCAMPNIFCPGFYICPFVFVGFAIYLLDVTIRYFQALHVSAVSSVSITPGGGLARLEIPLDRKLVRNDSVTR